MHKTARNSLYWIIHPRCTPLPLVHRFSRGRGLEGSPGRSANHSPPTKPSVCRLVLVSSAPSPSTLSAALTASAAFSSSSSASSHPTQPTHPPVFPLHHALRLFVSPSNLLQLCFHSSPSAQSFTPSPKLLLHPPALLFTFTPCPHLLLPPSCLTITHHGVPATLIAGALLYTRRELPVITLIYVFSQSSHSEPHRRR